jgi:methanogenic corrinoid protein MtbC1/DNA-binding transcriptional regulator YhcF (GntR family)
VTRYELGPRAQGVYQVLLDRIRSGELAPGMRLPAHTHLARSFGVAPLTVRQVLARLELEGVLVRERGRGTFVRAPGGPYVLIVVADAVQRPALEHQVRTAGKRAVVAATPSEALAMLQREGRPSLVIVDLHLPTASAGLRLVRRLRLHHADLPIAVLSPTRGQRTRLEHSVPPPLLFVGGSALEQLSQVLATDFPATGLTPKADSWLQDRLDVLLERYASLQLAGERAAARALFLQNRLAAGLSVAELYRFVLAPAQVRLGELWQRNQIGVAREHLATAVTRAVMADLAAYAPRASELGMRVVIACVQGELHDVGARMVADLLELDGFSVRFLGADVPTDSLLTMIAEESPRLVILSAAMAERVAELRAVVTRIRQVYDARIPIFVGGQVMHWAEQAVLALQVDLAARDALETVAAARRLLPDLNRAGSPTPPEWDVVAPTDQILGT